MLTILTVLHQEDVGKAINQTETKRIRS